MKNQTEPFRIRFLPATLAALLLFGSGCKTSHPRNGDASNLGRKESARLAQQMIGSWVQVGRPEDVPPARGGRYKYRTGTHWVVIRPDAYGLVKELFGGSYTMNGDEYVETQAFADSTWRRDNGKSFKFKVKVEGDLMTQIGVGNPYNELWKRVKLDPSPKAAE